MTSSRAPHEVGYLGRCSDCDKTIFTSRKVARRVLKTFHDTQGMREYLCPVEDGWWHLGHLPRAVLEGRTTADVAFGYRRVRLDD